MDGQHQNLDRTGYGGAAEIGGEQTGMEECCAERVQPSDRGWIRTEQNTIAHCQQTVCLSVCWSVYLPVCLSCLPACLPVCQSCSLCVCLVHSVCQPKVRKQDRVLCSHLANHWKLKYEGAVTY